MPHAEKVPALDGNGTSFLDSEQQEQLWILTKKTNSASRASLLVLHSKSVPRHVSLSADEGPLDNRGVIRKFFVIISPRRLRVRSMNK